MALYYQFCIISKNIFKNIFKNTLKSKKIGVCFLSTTFSNTIILERELGLNYSLKVMGCKTISYWIGTFLSDLLLASIYTLLMIIFGHYL